MRLIRGRSMSPRSWQIWELPGWVAGFVGVVVLADAGVLAAGAGMVTVHARDLELFAALLACIAATVEQLRRVGENAPGVNKDVYAAWELPAAVLLPLGYVQLLTCCRQVLFQWRLGRVPVYRRVFSAAAVGLGYAAASLAFRALIRQVPGGVGDPLGHAVSVIPIIAAAAVVQWAVNAALVMTAIKGSNPAFSVRDAQFSREPLRNDLYEVCVAALVTFTVSASWIALVISFPFVSLLQRQLRQAHLLRQRSDVKTGLPNVATWKAQAEAELIRAMRTESPLAVILLDLDRFKKINIAHGHRAGDEVLREVAHTLRAELREYDLPGRFSSAEFAVLLPQTRSADTFRVAERVRESIGSLTIIAARGRVPVTVSIGAAALAAGSERTLAELLTAAGTALHQAKAQGGDQVRMAVLKASGTTMSPAAGSTPNNRQ
jgi:diguanylate cyclase (GGDEF)-like protein